MEPFYPPWEKVLRAFEFDETEFDAVKVVIVGHDPYTSNGQADGLAFSVPAGIKHPQRRADPCGAPPSESRAPR